MRHWETAEKRQRQKTPPGSAAREPHQTEGTPGRPRPAWQAGKIYWSATEEESEQEEPEGPWKQQSGSQRWTWAQQARY